jgi:hypothetical protein
MFPFLVGLAVLLAGGVADLLAESYGPLRPDRLYAGSLGAALFLVAGSLVEALAARRAGPRARVDLWRATQFAAALLALVTWLQLVPVFDRATYLSGVSSRWEQLEPEHFIVPIGAALAALVLRRRAVPAGLPWRALAAVAVALVVLAGAELRLRRAAPPWNLLDNLPLVATLPPIDRAHAPAATSHPRADLWVRRFWSERYPDACDLSLARSEAGLVASIDPDHMVPVGCGELTLRALPVTREYVLVSPYRPYRSAFVLDGATLARRSLGSAKLGDYTDRIAPPGGWVRASWVTLGLGVLALRPRRRARRWLAARDRWRAATLDPDGTVRFDDGDGAASLSYGASVAPGPVVVLAPATRGEGGPFRGTPGAVALGPDDVRAGSPAAVLAELDADRDAAWARLAATAWLAVAPLAPFALRGMSF